MLITKDEATAAQRTIVFFAADATDGFTAEPAIDFSDAGDVRLSKAGGALGNATGVVTELADGFYQLVLSAADVDTLGDLVVTISNAGVRTIIERCQVVALDLNVATVNPGAGGIVAASFGAGAIDAAAIAADAIAATKIAAGAITAAKFAAGAIDAAAVATDAFGALELAAGAASEIRTGLATSTQLAENAQTRNTFKDLGVLNAAESTAGISLEHARRAVFSFTGDFDTSTVTVQVCHDPSAAVPVWSTFVDALGDNPLTAAGEVIVEAPVKAVRATMSAPGGASAVQVNLSISS